MERSRQVTAEIVDQIGELRDIGFDTVIASLKRRRDPKADEVIARRLPQSDF